MGVFSGFFNEEYLIAPVDFICSLRGHQRTRKKDSAEPSFPILWTPPHPPGVSAAAGHYCCRGLGAILESGIRCCRSSPVPNLVLLSVFGLVSFAFQAGCWSWIVRLSLLGGRSFVPAATCGLAIYSRRICADRDWIVCFCG